MSQPTQNRRLMCNTRATDTPLQATAQHSLTISSPFRVLMRFNVSGTETRHFQSPTTTSPGPRVPGPPRELINVIAGEKAGGASVSESSQLPDAPLRMKR